MVTASIILVAIIFYVFVTWKKKLDEIFTIDISFFDSELLNHYVEGFVYYSGTVALPILVIFVGAIYISWKIITKNT